MKALVLLLAACLVSSAARALTPVAQDRHVFASNYRRTLAGETFDSETQSAPNYAGFAGSVDGITFPLPGPPRAIQTSSIGANGLYASGTTIARPNAELNVIHRVRADSIYSVDFEVDEERGFRLTGQIELSAVNYRYPGDESGPCSHSALRITLSGPGGVIAEVAHSLPPVEFPPEQCFDHCEAFLPLSASGVLEPGSYRLEARSESGGEGIIAVHSECDASSTGSYQAYLVLTAPAAIVPVLPAPLAPLLGVALLGAARAGRRR